MEIQRHRAIVDGQELHYLRAGAGPPLLLIHGLFGGHFCWRCNIPSFAQGHATLAVDLPGFGESTVPRKLECSMEAQTRRLLSLLDRLQLETVDVVASSWGAGVALLLAAQTPRVRSLVLAAPVNPWSQFGRERVRFGSTRRAEIILRLGLPFARPVHRYAVKRLYGDPERIPAGTLEGYWAMMRRPGRAHNLLNTMRCWERDLQALSGAFERVHVPTLLIWGTRDGAVDIRSSDILMKKLPGCERAIIDGTGHLPFEETPEEFNRLVLGFLERVSTQLSPPEENAERSR